MPALLTLLVSLIPFGLTPYTNTPALRVILLHVRPQHRKTVHVMFWPWATQVPEEDKARRVHELTQQILVSPGQVASNLISAGRDPQCEEFAKRWLTSRCWDVSSAMLGVTEHSKWLCEQHSAGFVPVTDDQVPRALIENTDELFLQVTSSL